MSKEVAHSIIEQTLREFFAQFSAEELRSLFAKYEHPVEPVVHRIDRTEAA